MAHRSNVEQIRPLAGILQKEIDQLLAQVANLQARLAAAKFEGSAAGVEELRRKNAQLKLDLQASEARRAALQQWLLENLE